MAKKITYKTSGVDIEQANIFVDAIKSSVKNTLSASALQRKGSFGALFSLGTKKYREPVLVSSTDGVGTKLLVANLIGKHDTVGIDLVAMNVNDILCVGAKPLFFLDYIACGKLDPKVLKDVVKGIAKGCKQAGCSLIGGETAEMPGMYKRHDYDLAGFAVGVVEKKNIIDGSKISSGDIVIGLPSSGIHSNGYSLVRKVLSKAQMKKFSKEVLAPTKIYAKEVMAITSKCKVKAIAHITGGAFFEKLAKVLPKGKCFKIDRSKWPVPKIFHIIQKQGKIADKEMYRTFNMGIGMVVVVSKKNMPKLSKLFKRNRIKYYDIGVVVNDKNKRIVL